MYEPVWHAKKTQSAWGEAAAAVAALIFLALVHSARGPATDLHDPPTDEENKS